MKRWVFAAGIAALMAMLLWQREAAAGAVHDGLALCAAAVIPALFPFFVVSSLFVSLGAAQQCGRLLDPVTGRLLGCSGAGFTAFLLGALGGYPSGARAVGELWGRGWMKREEAQRALAFCSNCGPAFALGVCGGRFHAPAAAWCLLVIHLLAAGLTAQCFRCRPAAAVRMPAEAPLPLAEALVQAVTSGAQGMLSVCGFVVFFQVALRLALPGAGPVSPLWAGFWELTAGVLRLADSRAGFISAAALLGWGGVCVHCQTAAILSGTGLSLRYYLPGKALQAALSALLAALSARWIF